jgi:hypothetical protein
MKMEQILAQLLAEMNAIREEIDSSQERMEAKIDAHHEKMTAKMDAWIEGTEIGGQSRKVGCQDGALRGP